MTLSPNKSLSVSERGVAAAGASNNTECGTPTAFDVFGHEH